SASRYSTIRCTSSSIRESPTASFAPSPSPAAAAAATATPNLFAFSSNPLDQLSPHCWVFAIYIPNQRAIYITLPWKLDRCLLDIPYECAFGIIAVLLNYHLAQCLNTVGTPAAFRISQLFDPLTKLVFLAAVAVIFASPMCCPFSIISPGPFIVTTIIIVPVIVVVVTFVVVVVVVVVAAVVIISSAVIVTSSLDITAKLIDFYLFYTPPHHHH
ncbi:hypothetical protein AX774_g419, partial [Zancudomyces culisetae]